MATRRDQLLDSAICVLGDSGIHALTHRAVDAAAGRPAGSASNYFRSRDALLDAVVERFAVRERANWQEIAAELYPATPEELALALAAFAADATGPNRSLTMARYAILTEAGLRPSLRAQLAATGARVNAWFLHWIRIAGSANAERDAPLIMNHWTGLVLHQLALPDPAFDPAAQITNLVTAVMRPRAKKARS